MQNIKLLKNRFFLIFSLLAILILSFTLIIVWTRVLEDDGGSSAVETQEAEIRLTNQFGEEARKAVENFESNWMSLEMHLDPPAQFIFATEDFINLFGIDEKNSCEDEPFWLVTRQATVISLRVIEHEAKRMKVIACVDRKIDRTDCEGNTLEVMPLNSIQGIYVFIFEDDFWKLGGFVETTDPKQALQDWDYMSKDLKNVLGEIGHLVGKSCR